MTAEPWVRRSLIGCVWRHLRGRSRPRVRRYPGTPVVALAHRGGAAYAPNVGIENSRAAFATAAALGYMHMETDVHVTADGVLLALHDERLERVAGMSGAVADLPYAVVREARLGGREPIPSLGELLDCFGGTVFNIDVKASGAAPALWRELQRTGAHDRVCVGSFSPARLWEFRALARGAVATSAGPIGTAWLRFAPARLTRWVHSPGVAYQVPRVHRVLGWDVRVVTPAFVAAAHRIGRQVHVWTIDDRAEMVELLDMGVDGLVSDAIDVLADVLGERGAWPPRGGVRATAPDAVQRPTLRCPRR